MVEDSWKNLRIFDFLSQFFQRKEKKGAIVEVSWKNHKLKDVFLKILGTFHANSSEDFFYFRIYMR